MRNIITILFIYYHNSIVNTCVIVFIYYYYSIVNTCAILYQYYSFIIIITLYIHVQVADLLSPQPGREGQKVCENDGVD